MPRAFRCGRHLAIGILATGNPCKGVCKRPRHHPGRQMEKDTSTITTATNSVFHSRLQENNNNIKRVVESVKHSSGQHSFFPRQKPFLQCNGNRMDNDSNVRLRATAFRITRLWSGGPLALPQCLAEANLLLTSLIGASRQRAREFRRLQP